MQDSTYRFSEESNEYHTFENLDFGVPYIELNSQQNGNAGHSEFGFESPELYLQKQEHARDSNIESQKFESILRNDGRARGSVFNLESRDQVFPHQEYGEGFDLDSQNVNSASQVLEDKGGVHPSPLDLSEVELPLENDENEPTFNG